jgi:hypothetical protein
MTKWVYSNALVLENVTSLYDMIIDKAVRISVSDFRFSMIKSVLFLVLINSYLDFIEFLPLH